MNVKSKVLIFQPFGGISEKHFSICLEIISKLIQADSEIKVLSCNAKLPSCSYNVGKNKLECLSCQSKFKNGMNLLEHKNTLVQNFYKKIEFNKLKTRFNNLEELKQYKVKDFPIGMGVASSVISHYRNPKLDFENEEVKQIISSLIKSSFLVYFSLLDHLKDGYDACYFFNGRLAEFRAAFYACKKMNVQARIFEYGADISKYAIFFDHLPHDIVKTTELIEKFWESKEDKKGAFEIANSFYANRTKGIVPGGFSFVDQQDLNALPENFQITKKNITIFNSSEDELAAIGDEWKMTLYSSQIEALKKILSTANGLLNASEYHIYLRIHPNLAGINHDFQSFKNTDLFTIIPAESNVSTYKLMKNSSLVVSFGSTTGIEASYYGIPSVQLSPSFYQYLDSTYVPKNHQEVMEFFKTPPKPLSNLGAIKYAYYFSLFGIKKEITIMSNFLELDTVNGQKIENSWLVQKILNANHILHNKLKIK
jgi:hypothetical protein